MRGEKSPSLMKSGPACISGTFPYIGFPDKNAFFIGAGEMARWLRSAGCSGRGASVSMQWLTAVCSSDLRGACA